MRVEKLKSSGQRAANHSYQPRKTKPDKAQADRGSLQDGVLFLEEALTGLSMSSNTSQGLSGFIFCSDFEKRFILNVLLALCELAFRVPQELLILAV